MLLRLLVTHFLRQMAQEKVREAMEQRARAQGRPTGTDEEPPPPEELPPCDIGLVFATGVESGGLIDLLPESRRTQGPTFAEDSGQLEGRNLVIVESGVGSEAAAAATEDLIRMHTPEWIVSAGFAAALSSELKRGQIVMPNKIIDRDGDCLDVGFRIAAEVVDTTPGLHVGSLVSVDGVLRKRSQKEALFASSGAVACDMETAAIANVCRARKTRFLGVRVISDGIDDQLPRAIANFLEQPSWAGKIGALGGAIFKRPGTIKDWWKLKEDATKASDRLAHFLSGVIPQLK